MGRRQLVGLATEQQQPRSVAVPVPPPSAPLSACSELDYGGGYPGRHPPRSAAADRAAAPVATLLEWRRSLSIDCSCKHPMSPTVLSEKPGEASSRVGSAAPRPITITCICIQSFRSRSCPVRQQEEGEELSNQRREGRASEMSGAVTRSGQR